MGALVISAICAVLTTAIRLMHLLKRVQPAQAVVVVVVIVLALDLVEDAVNLGR